MDTQKPATYASFHLLARRSLGLMWLYQGFIPKIVSPSSGSIEVITLAGIDARIALDVLYGVGLLEIALGLTLLSGPPWRWPLWLNLVLAATYMLGTAIVAPKYLLSAYSSPTVGVLVVALTIVGLRTLPRPEAGVGTA